MFTRGTVLLPQRTTATLNNFYFLRPSRAQTNFPPRPASYSPARERCKQPDEITCGLQSSNVSIGGKASLLKSSVPGLSSSFLSSLYDQAVCCYLPESSEFGSKRRQSPTCVSSLLNQPLHCVEKEKTNKRTSTHASVFPNPTFSASTERRVFHSFLVKASDTSLYESGSAK